MISRDKIFPGHGKSKAQPTEMYQIAGLSKSMI